MGELRDAEALRALYGDIHPVAAKKVIDHLDGHCRNFIAMSPFFFLATSDGDKLDVSPKGDGPGCALALDGRTLAIPDWPGNSRIDGLLNIVQDPRVGLIFIVPNVRETLRVNGTASIHDDEDLRTRFETGGKLPITVTKVAVRSAFLHCARAFMRSRLWDPETWPAREDMPSMGEMIADHAGLDAPMETREAQEKRQSAKLY